uniref:Uncharacterized protein n=1 Tax=Oreochromis aureus TaxID=47969 RepID=A0AAZ1XK45_OREAU
CAVTLNLYKSKSLMVIELLKHEKLLVKEDNICLTWEDFWSLGLEQSMESTIGNACLKIVGEAAQRHGKDVHIADLYVVATWKDPQVNLLRCLPVRFSLIFLLSVFCLMLFNLDCYSKPVKIIK